METIKLYSDLQQSKKLAEILPLESADMYFIGHQSITNPKEWEYEDAPKVRGKYIAFDNKRIFYPCWSLAALLELMICPNLEEYIKGKWDLTTFTDESLKTPIEVQDCESAVDACVAMIERLHELNLL